MTEAAKSPAHSAYFFERLSSPQWIEPLRERGFFSSPPELAIDEGYVSAPRWPLSEFLARVASEAPEQVLEVALSIETTNERVHEDLTDAALGMPGALAARWADHEVAWIRDRSQLFFLLGSKLAKLVVYLTDSSEVAAALRLFRELFRPVEVVGESGRSLEFRSARARVSHYEYDQLLEATVEPLVAAAPSETITHLVDLLTDLLDLAEASAEDPAEDYSYIWRTRIEGEHRDENELPQALVSALRDAVVMVRGRSLLDDDELLSLLSRRDKRVLRRIKLYAFSTPPAGKRETVAQLVLHRETFLDTEPSPEYRTLLERSFGSLPESARNQILDWVEHGPDLESYVELRKRLDGVEPSPRELEGYAAAWRVRRLRLVQDTLPPHWRARYEELIDEFGEHEFITSFEVQTMVGQRSPLTLDELRVMNDLELLAYLRDWVAPPGHFEPSVEGLARALSELAQADPERISRVASDLRGLNAHHVYWTLIGLTAAVRDGKRVHWPPLLDFIEWVLQASLDSGTDEDDNEVVDSPEAVLSWARKEAAGLLEAGLSSEIAPLPFDARDRIWACLAQLAADANPTPEHEMRYGGSNMDPSTLALNTTRGRAFHALVDYCFWVKRNVARETEEEAREGFSLVPEVRETLENHLEPEVDSSLAVRAVYGQYYPSFVAFDRRWAESRRVAIFPQSSAQVEFWAAAWGAYVTFSRPYWDLLPILYGEYAMAIERLGEIGRLSRWLGSSETPDERLADHLVTFYWHDRLALDDQLITMFFARAPGDLRKHALAFIGRSARDQEELEPEVSERLAQMWQWRMGATSDEDEGASDELSSFAWWVNASSLDLDWRMRELERVLARGVLPQPDFLVLEALNEAVAERPLEATRLLRQFLDLAREGWTLMGGRSEIETLLVSALASDSREAQAVAEETVHWLGALGHQNFRRLLQAGQHST
ncbi:MAG: hypothetical protein ACRDNI_07335 [Gaiellaceae bacterium]